MADLRLRWDVASERADLVLDGIGFDLGHDLETWVVVSLFSDRLADPSDRLPAGSDRRGWWGDSYAENPGDHIGSRLWQLLRAKSTDATPLLAKGMIAEALQWMLDDGLCRKIGIETFFLPGGRRAKLGARITITRNDGGEGPPLRYDWAWQELAA